METAVKERLIGAAVLVVVVVLVVPALLRGPRPPAEPPIPADGETRVVEIDLGGGSRTIEPPPAPEPTSMPPALAAEPAAPPASPVTVEAPAEETIAGESPPAPAPPPAATGAERGGWAVQVAALSKREAADQMLADLGRRGFAAFVQEHRDGGRVLYRVRVGPEAGRDGAEGLARRLREAGFKTTVVAHP